MSREKRQLDDPLEQKQDQERDLCDEGVHGPETTPNGTNLTNNCLTSLKPEQDGPRNKFSVSDGISLGSKSLIPGTYPS